MQRETISEIYRDLNTQLHNSKPTFGAGGHQYAETVEKLALQYWAYTILDYGAGKCTLSKAMKDKPFRFYNYDPAIPNLNFKPPCDMVVSTDVLEHIEPEYLDNVLEDIRAHANKVAYLTICTRPANKELPDGRNAHLIVEPMKWWKKKLQEHWSEVKIYSQKKGIVEAVCRK